MTTKSLDTKRSISDGFLGGIALGLFGGMVLGGMLTLMALTTI
jgi:hypothetical protein